MLSYLRRQNDGNVEQSGEILDILWIEIVIFVAINSMVLVVTTANNMNSMSMAMSMSWLCKIFDILDDEEQIRRNKGIFSNIDSTSA